MKILIAAVIGVLSVFNAHAINDREWQALVMVESENGRTSDNVAQIRRILIDDINRILRNRESEIRYTYEDRTCPVKSRDIFNLYTDYYAGEEASFEKRAKIWNGGPKGHKREGTKGYWNKVYKELSKYGRTDSSTSD